MALAPIIALIAFGWFADGVPAVVAKTEPDLTTCQADMATKEANLKLHHEQIGLVVAALECVQMPAPPAYVAAPDAPAVPAPDADAPKPGIDNGE